ncbi:hypothetical protein GQ44DRAFT_724214 [Phaeosphaeriaceae sp. PMI808]|nr:hypothetical protein GQ44DRAFT_724214 [Phaeosphaeriaceae sp. PMI808]
MASKNMALRLGTTLCGSKPSSALCLRPKSCVAFNPFFQKTDGTSTNELHVRVCADSRTRAVVKSADLGNQTQMDCLMKEYKYYKKPSIESSRNFRKLCDIVNDPIDWTVQKPFYLAFEWMDTTLAEVPFEKRINNPILVANIVKVCLEAFAELEKEHLVYTAGPEGGNPRWVQPEAFRAPEVWTGVGCFHKADVWSIAAMVSYRPLILAQTKEGRYYNGLIPTS